MNSDDHNNNIDDNNDNTINVNLADLDKLTS